MNNDVNGPFEILGVDTGGKFRTKAMPGAPWKEVDLALGEFLSIAQLNDGRLLGVGSGNGWLFTVDTPTKNLVTIKGSDNPGSMASAVELSDGTIVGVHQIQPGNFNSGKLFQWDDSTDPPKWNLLDSQGSWSSMAQLADGTFLGVGSGNRTSGVRSII